MKSMRKAFLTLIILATFLISSLVIPHLALADGMIIRPDPFSDRWDYLGESNQQAFINYENGLQKMILSVGMEQPSQKAVWIFPVPAEPEKVVIDVVTQLPRLAGQDIFKQAKSNLLEIKRFLPMTQIYPIPFVFMRTARGPHIMELKGFGAAVGLERTIENDVIVHEHLEKEGITTEIITAKTAQALYQYLKNKNLKVEPGSIPVLDHYVGQEFTFVVSWISSRSLLGLIKADQKGVFVTFPTKKIYYPLLPTSVYGSKIVPATIRIMGFVSPKVFKNIKDYTEISYFSQSQLRIEPVLKNFYSSQVTKNVKYTKIEINAPSKMLTEDLWITRWSPIKTIHASFITKHITISGIFFLVISSIITGLLTGMIVFKEARNLKGLIKFGLFGLFNCLSIIGLTIATVFVKTKKVKEEDRELFEELKQKGYSTSSILAKDSRKFAFVPLFSVSFLVISWVVVKLIELTL